MRISVVIPTRGTEPIVLVAARSALAQSLAPHEVIVVADGQIAPALDKELTELGARVFVLHESMGANAARMRGVQESSGDYVALLDDDDRWLPDKLAAQTSLMSTVGGDAVCYSAVSIADCPTQVRPLRFPTPGQRVSDYLFVRRDFDSGSAFLSTSTLLVPRALLVAFPFDTSVPRHQDWDWLLRLTSTKPTVHLLVHPDPLTEIRLGHAHGISADLDWKASLRWALSVRPLLTDVEFGDLALVVSGSVAARARSLVGLRQIWAAAREFGRPTWRAHVTFVGFALSSAFPPRYRRRVLKAIREAGR